MPRLRNVIHVDVSPEQAWAVVGDVAGVHAWVPGVTTCRVEGDLRICNGGEIQEVIGDHSSERRSYRYTHVRVPLPVRGSTGTLAVEADGTGARVVWDAEFEVLDPAHQVGIVQMIDGYYKEAIESLRRRIEESAGHGR